MIPAAATIVGFVLAAIREATRSRKTGAVVPRLIVSLYDHTGTWSEPYRELGYVVLQVDRAHPPGLHRRGGRSWTLGLDLGDPSAYRVLLQSTEVLRGIYDLDVHGVLAAPPCRVFTRAGARLWPTWDASGETEEELGLVRRVLAYVEAVQPVWWALENPPGRLWKQDGTGLLQAELGEHRFCFDPHDYAGHLSGEASERERYTKRTCLYGDFQDPVPAGLEPTPMPEHLPKGRRDWVSRQSSSHKVIRQITPGGFAVAFALAND